jgi:hypothetical protein
MGSQATGLGVKNPRAKCAWRNLRPSSALDPLLSQSPQTASLPGLAQTVPSFRPYPICLSHPPSQPQPRTALRSVQAREQTRMVPSPILSTRARSRELAMIHPVAASTDEPWLAADRRRRRMPL